MTQTYFISYNSADRDWAHWIGWQVRGLGFTPRVHEWEIAGGQSVPAWMEDALNSADGMIAVVSPRFLSAKYSRAEVHAGIWRDFQNRKGFVKPIVVSHVQSWPIFLGTLKRLSLIEVSEEEAAKALEKFLIEPTAPLDKPSFPGVSLRSKRVAENTDLPTSGMAKRDFELHSTFSNATPQATNQSEPFGLPAALIEEFGPELAELLDVRSTDDAMLAKKEELAQKLNDAGLRQTDLGHVDNALERFRYAEQLLNHVFGEGSNSVAQVKTNRADALLLRGTHPDLIRALQLSREAVAAQEARFGPNPPEADISRTKVARVLLRLGQPRDLDEAIRVLEEAELVARKTETRRDIVGVKARVWKRLRTRSGLERAYEAEKRLLDDAQSSEEKATAVNNIAHTLWALGMKDEAEARLESAFDYYRQHFGDKHPTTLGAKSSLESLRAGERSMFATD